jgi:hypothetical protein
MLTGFLDAKGCPAHRIAANWQAGREGGPGWGLGPAVQAEAAERGTPAGRLGLDSAKRITAGLLLHVVSGKLLLDSCCGGVWPAG